MITTTDGAINTKKAEHKYTQGKLVGGQLKLTEVYFKIREKKNTICLKLSRI